MVKPLSFKGDKKSKKRKHTKVDDDDDNAEPSTKDLTLSTTDGPAQENSTTEDDTWVSADSATDLTGPIVLVIPTTPPTALATDATGKIFASPLENLIEGDPSTAEPHDVRQVWVATKVAGAEVMSFKGHHGKYLGCDRFGILEAGREAVSPSESFLPIAVKDMPGGFVLQWTNMADGVESYICVSEDQGDSKSAPRVRGDASEINFVSTLRIRMQARFKPKLKASRESKAREKISRKELVGVVGRRLDDEEVRRLKRARREGNYHEEILDVRVKGKHDKFAS